MGLPGDWLLDDFSLIDPDFPSLLRPRFLSYVTYWLNWKLAGNLPWTFRLTNILIHAAGVQMCFQALRRLVGEHRAFVAAAMFAVCPIQADAVLYVFGRPVALMGLMLWLALDRWLVGQRVVAVGCYTAALLAKEEAAAFPLFLLALEYLWLKRRQGLREIAAMAGLAVVAVVGTFVASSQIAGSGAGDQAGVRALSYLATQPKVIGVYLSQLAVPYFWGFTWQPEIWPAACALLWVGILGGLYWARRWEGSFWVLSGLLFLLPTSSVFPIADVAAFRRMYLPVAFLFAALPVLRPTVAGLWIVLLAGVSAERAFELYRQPVALWRATIERQPGDLRALLQLCRYLEPSEALQELEKRPSSAANYQTELGRVYLELRRPGDALRAFGKALADDPSKASNFYNRGVALLALGQQDAARADFERTLGVDPQHKPAREALLQLARAPK